MTNHSEALQFDEAYYVLDVVDAADPESLSNVISDMTPAFNFETCLQDNLEAYLPFIRQLPTREADILLMHYICGKQLNESSKLLKLNKASGTHYHQSGMAHLALLLQGKPLGTCYKKPTQYLIDVILEPGLELTYK